MIGTLTRKTEPHQKCSSSQPPITGPSGTAIPAVAVQMAIARPRYCGGKMLVKIDNVEGMMKAPPNPISARLAINWLPVPA